MTTDFFEKIVKDFEVPKDVPSTYAYLDATLQSVLTEFRVFLQTPLQPIQTEYLKELAFFDHNVYTDIIDLIQFLREMVDKAIANGACQEIIYVFFAHINIVVTYFDNKTIEIACI